MNRFEIILTKEEKESLVERISIINKIQTEITELNKLLEENINYLTVIWTAVYRRNLIERITNSDDLAVEVPPIFKEGKLNIRFKETFGVLVDGSEKDG